VRIVNGIAQLAQSIVGEGVRGSGVVKAGGEEGRIGEDCQTGEVGGVGICACWFVFFLSCLYSFIFESTVSRFNGISPVLTKELCAIVLLLKTLSQNLWNIVKKAFLSIVSAPIKISRRNST
jgi:hypothetical protein